MPDVARIGQVFAERRIALRLTQQTLADLAGVSRSTIQALERGAARSNSVQSSKLPKFWGCISI
ncbi:helix-turn-helix family protein [Mycobacterium xenopi 3993]|nr:helix-turn-helix family protein [Mycobacterium xenopi 3993]